MKIYLAGNGAMPADQRERVYQMIKARLISYYETQPGRFCNSQWKYINENLSCKHKPGGTVQSQELLSIDCSRIGNCGSIYSG